MIPARSGSKGIKNKNLALLGDKPLIEYTFELASSLQSKFIKKIILSTDSEEIISLSKKFHKIHTPFIRPTHLATDSSNVSDVVIHALDYYSNLDESFDYVLLLQPTTPFRKPDEIDDAIETSIIKNFDSSFGVCKIMHHPREYIKIKENSFLNLLPNTSTLEQRQGYEELFFISGAFYFCSTAFLIKYCSFINEGISHPIILSQETCIDIDEPFDLKIARGFLSQEDQC